MIALPGKIDICYAFGKRNGATMYAQQYQAEKEIDRETERWGQCYKYNAPLSVLVACCLVSYHRNVCTLSLTHRTRNDGTWGGGGGGGSW